MNYPYYSVSIQPAPGGVWYGVVDVPTLAKAQWALRQISKIAKQGVTVRVTETRGLYLNEEGIECVDTNDIVEPPSSVTLAPRGVSA
jgi:hypothetical protein